MNTNKMYRILLLAFSFLLFSCREETPVYQQNTDAKDLERIFLVRSNVSQNLTIYPLQETRETSIGVGYGGLKRPSSNIKVTLAVDHAALDSINAARRANAETEYLPFPAGSYSFDKMDVTVEAGKLYSDYIKMTYKPAAFDYRQTYVLPISITDASGYKISTSKTIMLTVPKVEKFTEISRTNWDVTFSSEEAAGEGANNGRAIHTIDDNVSTFWHSQWWPSAPGFPHWLNYDMKEAKYVSKIAMHRRLGNDFGPTKFYVEGSVDGTTWEKLSNDVETFDPALVGYQEYELVRPKSVRYVKVTFTEGNRAGGHVYISEFKAYTTPEALRN